MIIEKVKINYQTMFKKILLIVILIAFTSTFAQDTIHGKMIPAKKYSWIILYKLNGVNQKYVANSTVTNGEFTIEIPKGSTPGMYRVLYDNNNNKFIDVIYNNESIDFEFHPNYPAELVKFEKSDENKLYQEYIEKISSVQNNLDSIQVVYFKTKDTKEEKKLTKIYTENLKNAITLQSSFEEKTNDKLASHYVKASKRYYSNTLIKDTNEYLEKIKAHFFDYVDFSNPNLAKSSLLIDRVMDYVMYLNTSDDIETLIKLRKDAIATVLSKIEAAKFKKDIIESLAYTFGQQENAIMVAYLFDNHYSKLPISLQDFEFKKVVMDMLKTTIGQQAPNIVWQEKRKDKTLYKLKGHKYYLVVFWSSTCPHCLQELPRLQKLLEGRSDIKTIAIGLETEESKLAWKEETFYYENFIHILGTNKYKNKYVDDYGVTSTPNFFLLNENKTIIEKPYDVKALKKIFEDIKPEKKK